MLVYGAGVGIIGPLLPDIARDFRQPLDVTGLLLACFFTGALLSSVVGGFLADRFGKKLLFLIALGGLGISYLLFSISPTFVVLIIACFISGSMGSVTEGLASTLIADLDPKKADRNITLLQVAFSIGVVVALLLTVWIHDRGGDWRLVFASCAGAIGVCWLLSLGMKMPVLHIEEPITLTITRKVLSDRTLLLLALGIAFYVGAEMSFANWISPTLRTHFHYSQSIALLAPGIFWSFVAIGRILSAIFTHRFSGVIVLRWLLVGGLLSCALLLLPLTPWRVWTITMLTGLSFSGIWPLLVSLGSARYPQYSGTVVAIMVASGTAGGVFFPSLVGFIIERLSPFCGFLTIGLIFAGLVISTLMAVKLGFKTFFNQSGNK